jgi:phenylacetic acid degradation operon negative regulatory protein
VSKRRNTTLTARSVLLSMLLGNQPPRAPVGQLVRTAGLFGLAEGTTRTALSRMVAAGEVAASDGWYEISAERLLARQERQSISRSARTSTWDGQGWVQAIVVTDGPRSAAERTQLRHELGQARLAELREGAWLRPDNLDDDPTHRPTAAGTVEWFRVVPSGDPVRLAARLWDLDAWARHAESLIARLDGLAAPLADGDHRVLADGFVASADVLRHFQADPLLPAALLPEHWPGGELRARYDSYDAAYRALLAAWFRSHG